MIVSTSPQRPTTSSSRVRDHDAGRGRAPPPSRPARRSADWRAPAAAARSAALGRAADAVQAAAGTELADLVVREVGKPLAEARGEVARSVAILRYYAQQVVRPDRRGARGRRAPGCCSPPAGRAGSPG